MFQKLIKSLETLIYKADNSAGIESKILQFFTLNKPPYLDKEYHKFAEDLGINPSKAEQTAYNLLGSILSGGTSQGKRPSELSDEQLKQGMQIEAEHTDNKYLQEKIVYDHITELGIDYYPELIKLEEKLKAKKK
jgi:hypothetical protein